MLQSMNAYSMYIEPEHRQIFYVTAPEFLHRMSRLGLSLVENTEEEEALLTSLPRCDHSAGFRRDPSSCSFPPGTLEEMSFDSSCRVTSAHRTDSTSTDRANVISQFTNGERIEESEF
ncbi:unnamed protein product [Rodentolepis nana]|uniref:Potassium channel subfamily T member 1 n=1 Tax=Rodentolepis nana TaxID=102285 RepID=A0A0R3TJ80_RODNA|nr:unnamed protein product [Rodentolepis nana]